MITFNEDLDTSSTPPNSAFTVKKDVGGTATEQTLTGTPSVSGATVTLTLSTAVTSTDTEITVKYTKPGSGTDNRIRDALGNETATFDDEDVTNSTTATDTTAPTVTSIERQTPGSSPTNADSLTWRITFSENVQNVDGTDFSVSGTTATLTAAAVTGSESQYDVTASGGDLADLDATVTLSFASGQNITDKATTPNALSNTTPTSTTNENSYVVDNTAPRVVSIERQNPSRSPTNANSVTWRITFSEAVKNVGSVDLRVVSSPGVGSTQTTSMVSGSGDTQFDTVIGGPNLTNYNGTLTVTVSSSHDIKDNANNALTNLTPTSTNDNTYRIDNTAPTFSSAAINGATLVITFNENLLTTSTLRTDDFEVTKGASDTVQSLTGTPSITGATVTLTLSSAVSSADDNIKVGYTRPSANVNRVRDEAGNAAATFADSDAEDVTNNTAANTAPTASNGEVETNEDTDYTFEADDFNFADTDTGDALESVKITSLPGSGKGSLELDGTALTATDLPKTVTKAELDDDDLVYSPPANASGDDYTTFKFKVNDGDDDSTAEYTMTIDVEAVNDAPVVDNAIPDQAATAGSAFSYAFPANTFSDVDDTALDYSATKSDDTALPSWLTFTESTRTFSGTPAVSDIGTLSVKVKAEDGDDASVTDTFDIVVSPTITIAAEHESLPLAWVSPVGKLTFTLTRTGPTTNAVDVPVTLTQDEAWLASTRLSRTVTIAAGDSTATFQLDYAWFWDDNSATLDSGDLTAALGAVDGYDTDDAEAEVYIHGRSKKTGETSLDMEEYSFAEDSGNNTLYVTEVTLDPNVTPTALPPSP